MSRRSSRSCRSGISIGIAGEATTSRKPFRLQDSYENRRIFSSYPLRNFRTTVDLKAMAASCTLQAARASMEAGRHEEAQQLLYAVVRNYPESEYAFYVERAKVWMKDLPAVDPPVEPTSLSEL